ncbi:MAG: CBS domain-containing protein [Burkholderiales bacterium]|jgi:CBS domain-containing protein
MQTVADIVKKHNSGLWRVKPTDSVFDALRLLAQYEIGALLVMDSAKLVGVFSERDYTRKVALQGKSSKDVNVGDIMSRNVAMVTPATRTRDCMRLMSQKKIRHLPVLEGPTVVGMISILDLMDEIIADHEITIEQLHHYIHS